MRSVSLPRAAATTAVVSGVALLGAALGGMAHVDSELAAAAAPARPVTVERVVLLAPVRDCTRTHAARRGDRPEL